MRKIIVSISNVYDYHEAMDNPYDHAIDAFIRMLNRVVADPDTIHGERNGLGIIVHDADYDDVRAVTVVDFDGKKFVRR